MPDLTQETSYPRHEVTGLRLGGVGFNLVHVILLVFRIWGHCSWYLPSSHRSSCRRLCSTVCGISCTSASSCRSQGASSRDRRQSSLSSSSRLLLPQPVTRPHLHPPIEMHLRKTQPKKNRKFPPLVSQGRPPKPSSLRIQWRTR